MNDTNPLARPEDDTPVLAGAAVRDITPVGATTMSGYAARIRTSEGIHDPLSVRALVVDRTALVTVDVVGLHEDFCSRIRSATRAWADHVIVHATHTHSGPGSVPGRLGGVTDDAWLADLEMQCIAAIEDAATGREPVRIVAGYGEDPDVARNRRRGDGPVDRSLPVVRCERADGTPLALLVSYSCHPVVLGADNLLLSADYPGVVRAHLEQETGATVLFATSCAGDLNTGHSLDHTTEHPDGEERTFPACASVGHRIAAAALAGRLSSGPQHVDAATAIIALPIRPPSAAAVERDAARWAELARTCPPADRPLLDIWLRWARDADLDPAAEWSARVTLLRWGPVALVALPGEPFCAASLRIRERIHQLTGAHTVLVIGYSDGCPGYLPAEEEYPCGGYEVTEAHRYYGMPGPFAPGALEQLVAGAVGLARELPHSQRSVPSP